MRWYMFLTLTTSVLGQDDWHYHGSYGVDNWPNWYETCAGSRQSPIDLRSSSCSWDSTLQPLNFTNFDNVANMRWHCRNNGHSVQVNYRNGDLRIGGGGLNTEFSVIEFHFHWGSTDSQGSEHLVNGKAYPMEIHIMGWNRAYGSERNAMLYPDGLLVLGILVEIQASDNPIFTSLVQVMKVRKVKLPSEDDAYGIDPFPLWKLLPVTKEYYRYYGGLTVPPCSENVVWIIFRKTIKISSAQLAAFRDLKSSERDPNGGYKNMRDNFRTIQPLSGRKISVNFRLT